EEDPPGPGHSAAARRQHLQARHPRFARRPFPIQVAPAPRAVSDGIRRTDTQVPLLFVNEFSARRSLYSALRLTLTSLSLAHLVVQLSQTRERVGREQYHSHEIGITLRSRTRRH